jgi:transposase
MASERTASRLKTRRSYSDEFKAQVMAECEEPGASVAKVAMSHGINDNVVHRWRQLAREGRRPVAAPRTEFVPLALTTAGPSLSGSGHDIRVEIRRGVTAITVSWPLSAATECAAWMRDWLK